MQARISHTKSMEIEIAESALCHVTNDVLWRKVWISNPPIELLSLRTGNHHVAMNIINGLVFNDIHTHMIDDFLFSNLTAQLGGRVYKEHFSAH